MTTLPRTRLARTLAAVTIAAASFGLTGCSLLGNVVADPAPSANPTEGTETDAFAIGVGDCLNDGGVEGEVSSVVVIDCAQPHDSEAYSSIQVPDGDYPGEDAILAQAEQDCLAAFNTFAGINYDQSTLSFSYYYPTEGSWGNGDREILCLILDPAGKTVGTLANAAR
ncbi:MAG TPA: septum formation family protein [Rhodoglobus sp.]|nr:septum formation family protein [Rhodoglobus sp.]HOY80726.1 septum formation family protein [Rhodoglobus sp.]HQA23330.1 septum formation family protein [Rhodoglobus sp.]HQE45612.1 septum formation family protein [Rhodoglobus sp.]HQJ34961.1 septum formation family protein [Rhodoglobus sp.]